MTELLIPAHGIVAFPVVVTAPGNGPYQLSVQPVTLVGHQEAPLPLSPSWQHHLPSQHSVDS